MKGTAGREVPGGCGEPAGPGPLSIKLEALERRIRRLERWRKSMEESEFFMDRYRRLFHPPRPLLEKGERDIQRLRELIEKKRAETRGSREGRAKGRRPG